MGYEELPDCDQCNVAFDIYSQGYDSALYGNDADDSPYNKDSEQYTEWMCGWSAAASAIASYTIGRQLI